MKPVANLEQGWVVEPSSMVLIREPSINPSNPMIKFYELNDNSVYPYRLPQGVTFADIVKGIDNCRGDIYILPPEAKAEDGEADGG